MQCKIFKLKSHSGNPSSQRNEGSEEKNEITLKTACQIWCKIKKLKTISLSTLRVFFSQFLKSINDADRKITPQDDVVLVCSGGITLVMGEAVNIASVMYKRSFGNFKIFFET